MKATNDAASLLGVRYPIVQGPFGGGLSTSALTAAVSNRGGLGSYGAHMLPAATIEALVRELRGLTSAPFAVNLWVSDHDPGGLDLSAAAFERMVAFFRPYFRELGIDDPSPPERFQPRFDEQVEAVLEARPPIFSFVFGVPKRVVIDECKRRAILTIGAATSIAEAQALEEGGVDLVVATGCEAGGHRPSFLARAEDSLVGSFALTQLVARRVKIPVIAAGGIACGRGIRAAITLGASAAQLGTAFLACNESGASERHRAQLFGDGAHHTVLTRAFTGRLARGIENRFTSEMRERSAIIAPYPMQSWFVSQLKAASAKAHRSDLVSLWSGQIAPNLKHHDVATLMNSLIEEIAQ